MYIEACSIGINVGYFSIEQEIRLILWERFTIVNWILSKLKETL
jgi:hypothetical protein